MEIAHVQKKYGKKEVLKDISLHIKQGTCVGILGGNGSGKSTLLSVLAGVLKRDAGTFFYDGADLFADAKKRAQIIGYVPQGTPLMEELSAKDNLRLWYSAQEIFNSIDAGVLGMLGIEQFLDVPVCKMSGGMKKRLAIGCAVAHQPRVLLLDEPSAALDLICKERIYNYLADFKAQGGTILLATHDVQELALCDALYILKNGVLHSYVYDGNIHRLVGQL